MTWISISLAVLAIILGGSCIHRTNRDREKRIIKTVREDGSVVYRCEEKNLRGSWKVMQKKREFRIGARIEKSYFPAEFRNYEDARRYIGHPINSTILEEEEVYNTKTRIK